MTNKHTPGPWTVHPRQRTFIRANDGKKHVASTASMGNEETDIANARLISAAVDLLEVARTAASMGFHEMPKGQPACKYIRCEMVSEAIAAIAKATTGD